MLASAGDGKQAWRLFEQRQQPLHLRQPRLLRGDVRGGLGAGAVHAGDVALLVDHRRVGEREPGGFLVALALHGQRQVFHVDRLAGHRARGERADVVPDLRPDLLERPPDRGRVLGAQDLGVGIVVEEAQRRPPGHEHRELRSQQQADHAAQRLRPSFRRSQRRLAPVVVAHQCGDGAGCIEEAQVGAWVHGSPRVKRAPIMPSPGDAGLTR